MALRLSTGLRNMLLGDGGSSDGSFQTLFTNGTMKIYSGSQPTDPDADETGTMLVQITESGGTFTPGTATNGINFANASSGSISKASGETWNGTGAANGTMGWFRFYANAADTTVTFDGSIGTSSGQLTVSSTTVTSGVPVTVDSFTITLPAS